MKFRVDPIIYFGSSFKIIKNKLEQNNKMADKIKMAAKHEFSISQSIETWDLERTSYKK
jgi:hypothetical protein